MISTRGPAVVALLATLAFLPPAQAVEYGKLVPERSKVAFAYTQMGVGMEGGFKVFAAELAFDPARPEAGKAMLSVELASIDTGLDEANAEAAGKDWFDVKRHPAATFASSRVEALGGEKFAVTGTFTLKGRSREITVPVTYRQEAGQGVFEGSLDLLRNDYGIGAGPWAAVDVVADEVAVTFSLVFDAR